MIKKSLFALAILIFTVPTMLYVKQTWQKSSIDLINLEIQQQPSAAGKTLMKPKANLPSLESDATGISLNYQGQSLNEVTDDIKRQSGIEFKAPETLSGDFINRSAQVKTWADAVREILIGYNYAGLSGDDGKLNNVIITGRSGNGSDTAERTVKLAPRENDLLAYQAHQEDLPAKYQGYAKGSVTAIKIAFEQLSKAKIGDKVPITLPTGQYDIVHDNVFKHKNEDKTWVGYLDQEGKEYRVVITSGNNGGIGQITTPDGEYQIDLENDTNYLINLNASGLTHGSLIDDQGVAEPQILSDLQTSTTTDLTELGSDRINRKNVSTTVAETTNVHSNATAITPTMEEVAAGAIADTGPIIVNGTDLSSSVVASVIDVLILFTSGMDTSILNTRLNQLIALTNQAYIDSKIAMALRLVGKQKVDYPETNANSKALGDLTNGVTPFSGIATLRQQLGADLVVLIRPYYKATQLNCGYTWINGANGSSLVARLGFSTVSDGTDRAGAGYYCNDYTFAHETGHSFGNVHERGANAPTPGAYPFAYGWGLSGNVGTIMSYLRPLVPRFANPNIICNGLACGVPTTATNSADNAATINLTGAKVANFMPKTVQ